MRRRLRQPAQPAAGWLPSRHRRRVSYIGMASYTHMSMGHASSSETASSIDSACTIE
ncbi:hypothetical protein ACFRAU_14465 [Arthrobacter sp. NPDC056691]|uniref:hypothetical protein n=1 Tax=Arthrobacter sp. NPDC056691 TaxID=3345913 RepID=UPI00366BA9EE